MLPPEEFRVERDLWLEPPSVLRKRLPWTGDDPALLWHLQAEQTWGLPQVLVIDPEDISYWWDDAYEERTGYGRPRLSLRSPFHPEEMARAALFALEQHPGRTWRHVCEAAAVVKAPIVAEFSRVLEKSTDLRDIPHPGASRRSKEPVTPKGAWGVMDRTPVWFPGPFLNVEGPLTYIRRCEMCWWPDSFGRSRMEARDEGGAPWAGCVRCGCDDARVEAFFLATLLDDATADDVEDFMRRAAEIDRHLQQHNDAADDTEGVVALGALLASEMEDR